jgi:hypothetical protein
MKFSLINFEGNNIEKLEPVILHFIFLSNQTSCCEHFFKSVIGLLQINKILYKYYEHLNVKVRQRRIPIHNWYSSEPILKFASCRGCKKIDDNYMLHKRDELHRYNPYLIPPPLDYNSILDLSKKIDDIVKMFDDIMNQKIVDIVKIRSVDSNKNANNQNQNKSYKKQNANKIIEKLIIKPINQVSYVVNKDYKQNLRESKKFNNNIRMTRQIQQRNDIK